ncbi:hypothetical protein KR084_008927 [Drosophila pseudotakahashii]|nr:hypothetical protein KR084_008927 [Drosophila pseudotakahashii]
MSKSPEDAVVTNSAPTFASRDGVNGSSVDHQGNSPPLGAPSSQADSGFFGINTTANSSVNKPQAEQSYYYSQGAAASGNWSSPESPAFSPITPQKSKFWAPFSASRAVRIPNAEPYFASPKRSRLSSSQQSSPRLQELRSSTPVTSPLGAPFQNASIYARPTGNSDGPQFAPKLHARTPTAEEYELLSDEQRQIYQVGQPTSYQALALREFEEVNEPVAEQLLQENKQIASQKQQKNKRIASQKQQKTKGKASQKQQKNKQIAPQKQQKTKGKASQKQQKNKGIASQKQPKTKGKASQKRQPSQQIATQKRQPSQRIAAQKQQKNKRIASQKQPKVFSVATEVQDQNHQVLTEFKHTDEPVAVLDLPETQPIVAKNQVLNEQIVIGIQDEPQIPQETLQVAPEILREDIVSEKSEIEQNEEQVAVIVQQEDQNIVAEIQDLNQQIVIETQDEPTGSQETPLIASQTVQENQLIGPKILQEDQTIASQIPQEDIEVATEVQDQTHQVTSEFEQAEGQVAVQVLPEVQHILTENPDINGQIVVEIQDKQAPQENQIQEEDQKIPQEDIPIGTEVSKFEHNIQVETVVQDQNHQASNEIEQAEEQVAVQVLQEVQKIVTENQDLNERIVVEIQDEPIVSHDSQENVQIATEILQENQLINSPIQQEDRKIQQEDIPTVTEIHEFEPKEEVAVPLLQEDQNIVTETQDLTEQIVIEIQDEPILSQLPQENQLIASHTYQEDIPTVTEIHEFEQKEEAAVLLLQEDQNIVTETQDLTEQIVIEIQDEPILSQLPQENQLIASHIHQEDIPTVTEIHEFEQKEEAAVLLLQEDQNIVTETPDLNEQIVIEVPLEGIQIATEVHDQHHQVLSDLEQAEEQVAVQVLQEDEDIATEIEDIYERIVVEIQDEPLISLENQPIPTEILQENQLIASPIQEDQKIEQEDLTTVTEIHEFEPKEEVAVLLLQEDQNIVTETQDLTEAEEQVARQILQEDQKIVTENQDLKEQIVIEIQDEPIVLQVPQDNQLIASPIQQEDQKIQQEDIPTVTEIHELEPKEEVAVLLLQEDQNIVTETQDLTEQIVIEIQDEPILSQLPQENQLIASHIQQEDIPTATEIHEFEPKEEVAVPLLQEDENIVTETQDLNEQIVIEIQDEPILSQLPQENQLIASHIQQEDIPTATEIHEFEPKEEAAILLLQEDQNIVTETQDLNEQIVIELQDEPILSQLPQENQLIASHIQQEDIPTATEIHEFEPKEEAAVLLLQEDQNIVTETQDLNEQIVIEIQDEPILSQLPQDTQLSASETYQSILREFQQEEDQAATQIQEGETQVTDHNQPILREFQQEDEQLAVQVVKQDFQFLTEIQDLSRPILVLEEKEDDKIAPGILQENQNIASQLLPNDVQIVAEIEDHNEQISREFNQIKIQLVTETQDHNQPILREFQQEDEQIQPNNQKAASPILLEDINIVTEIQEQNDQILRAFQQEEDETAAHILPDNQEVVTESHNHIDQIGIEVEEKDIVNQYWPKDVPIETEIQYLKQPIFREFQQEEQQFIPQKEQHFASEHKLRSQLESEIQFYLQIAKSKGETHNQNYQQDLKRPVGSEIRYFNQELISLLEFKKQYYQSLKSDRPQVSSLEVDDNQPQREVANQTDSPAKTDRELLLYLACHAEEPLKTAETQREQNQDPIHEAPEQLVEPQTSHPYTQCVNQLLNLTREACDNLIANPDDPKANEYRTGLFVLRRKLAKICHNLVDEAFRGESCKQSVALLREIFVGIEDTAHSKDLLRGQRATRETYNLETDISMGLDLLKRLRQLFTGWYKPQEGESDNGEAGPGTEGRNGAARGDDSHAGARNSAWKRRHQEDNTRPIKYRRVDNSFPRFITNEPADDLIPSKSMAERERENHQQGSKRLSIFNSPVYTQHRVRNEAPYIPNPFDVSDDDEPAQRFGNAAGPSARHPQLLYSDAVRLGQNGFGEARVNGHSAHAGRRAPAQVEKSILTHEMERMEHEQYMNLIHTVTHNESVASRFAKPNLPPLQRIDAQPATWSSMLHNSQSRPLQQPSSSRRAMNRHDNRGLSEYARLISSQTERQKPTPAAAAATPPPQLMPIGSFSNSRASTLSSSSEGSDNSNSSSSLSLVMTTAIEDSSTEKKANTITNHTGASQLPSAQPTRLALTDALHRRFASCVYLKDDFVEQFKAKSARIHEETEHRRELAAVV